MIWHTSSSEQVLSELKSDSERGLSSGEVSRRIIKYGTNRFDERRRESFPTLVMSHIKEPVTVILLIAALVYFIMGLIAPESGLSGVSVAEPIVILFIVVLNALYGALQKTRAQAAVASLELISPPSARVLRNGRETAVPSTNIVPGDIMLLSKGCYIPADGRVISADGLRCSESIITGVTVDADKFSGSLGEDILSAADQKNMVFSGCTVTAGTGKAVVVNTGKFTELSKISIVSGKPHSASVLQKRLKELGGILGVFAFVICAVILVFGTLFGKEEGGIFSNFISKCQTREVFKIRCKKRDLSKLKQIQALSG